MFTNRLIAFGRQFAAANMLRSSLRTVSLTSTLNNSNYGKPSPIEFIKTPFENTTICKNIIETVNNQLEERKEGRLFAVIHLCGKQFKVTAGDIILVEGYWMPTIGDKLRLGKVLVAGGDDFSLIGRPILHEDLVDVQATIIEKSISHTKPHFRKKRRKQYMRMKFQRSARTMIRINSIEVTGRLDEHIPDNREIRLFD